MKPLPRYFWMVFALAGDSTMTKPFDNGSSIFLEFVLKLARMSSWQQVTGRKLRASSYELRVRTMRFGGTECSASHRSACAAVRRTSESKSGSPSGRENGDPSPVGSGYSASLARPTRDLQKTAHLAVRSAAATFGNVRPNRSSGPTQLACQPVHLFPGKGRRNPICVQRHLMRFPPHFQLFEIRHASSSILKCRQLQLVAHSSKLMARS